MPGLRKHLRFYLLAVLTVATFLIWKEVFYLEDRRGRVFLHVFDVGQGDAIFIEAPSGNQVLIDGGPDDRIMEKLAAVMPFWDRAIDLVILTHPHADHLDGLVEVLKRYEVGMVLESGVNHSIPEYGEWRDLMTKKNLTRVTAQRGQTVRLGRGVVLNVLTPFQSFDGITVKNVHDAAVVIKLEYASSSALLMADAEAALEKRMVLSGDNLKAEVLKIGHHGSKTSTSKELLEAVRPRFAVISVGRKNRYGHPVQEVLDRLADYGIKIYRTDRDGNVVFMSNGKNFSLRQRSASR